MNYSDNTGSDAAAQPVAAAAKVPSIDTPEFRQLLAGAQGWSDGRPVMRYGRQGAGAQALIAYINDHIARSLPAPAAPVEGQVGLAIYQIRRKSMHGADFHWRDVPAERYYAQYDADEFNEKRVLYLAAPVAATEQATDDTPEVPEGAMHNGEVFANMLENIYDFACEAGPLSNCLEWTELRRCMAAMREYISSTPLATPADAGAGLDDQEWDRQAEQLTIAAGMGGGKINMNATSVLDIFVDDDAADAGAGPATKVQLTDEQINEVWAAARKQNHKMLSDSYDFRIVFARAIEREIIAHQSTPAAPVTSRDPDHDHFSPEQVQAIVASINPGDGWSGEDWEFALANAAARKIGKSPAPVTVEPVAIDLRHEFEMWKSNRGESAFYEGDGHYQNHSVTWQFEAFIAGIEVGRSAAPVSPQPAASLPATSSETKKGEA